MGWFDTVLSIGTTVGKIAGALSGASSEQCVHFGEPGDINPGLGSVIFHKNADGTTSVFNQSVSKSVGLSFPGNPLMQVDPLEIIVPATNSLVMDPAFQNAAAIGKDNFVITPLQGPNSQLGGPKNATVRSSTSKVVKDQLTVKVGPFLTATLNAAPRTVQIAVVGLIGLASIVVLSGSGASGNSFNIFGAVRKPDLSEDDDTQITVDIPAGINIDEGLTYIEVTAEVLGMPDQGFVPDWYTHALADLTDDDRALIAGLTAP